MYKPGIPVVGVVVLAACLVACGGPVDTSGPCHSIITSNISAPTTWAHTSGCDYLVQGDIIVSSALTLQPGTAVKFDANASLKVESTGSLNAVGTPTNRILLLGNTATTGFWKGIAFRSNNPANELTNVDIFHAGGDALCCDYFESSDIKGSVILGGAVLSSPSTLKMTNSSISKSGGYGLYLFRGARLSTFTGNSLHGNTKAPVSLPLSVAGSLDSATIYSGVNVPAALNDANTEQYVRVTEATAADTSVSQTLHKLDVPYGMGANHGSSSLTLDYQGTLTVDPGVRLEFEANTGLKITETGRLVANGTASDKVVFTGRVATKGFWLGLAFRSNGSTLNNVTVSNGGGDAFCCDYFDGGADIKANIAVGGATESSAATVTLMNSTVSDSLGYGVYKFGNGTVTDTGTAYSGNTTNKNF